MRRNNRRVGQASGNFNVQASLDVRDVATMAQFLIARGEITNEKYGKIISWCFDLGLNYLRQRYSEELIEFEGIEEAIHALDVMGYSVDQFKVNGNRRLLQAASRQAVAMDFAGEEFSNYGVGSKMKNERPTTNSQPRKEQLEDAARALYASFGAIQPGFEYLFVKPAQSGPDNSEILTLMSDKDNSPEGIKAQNWANAKIMAKLILEGLRTKNSPDALPFATIIDRAIEEVLSELQAEREQKEATEKARLHSILMSGPGAIVEEG